MSEKTSTVRDDITMSSIPRIAWIVPAILLVIATAFMKQT
jgi:hypothetical protein